MAAPASRSRGTTQKLDSLGDRLMYRLAYRNFGDHEALVVDPQRGSRAPAGAACAGTRSAIPAARRRSTSRARTRPTRSTAGWPARAMDQRRRHRRRLQPVEHVHSTRRSPTRAARRATRWNTLQARDDPGQRDGIADLEPEPLGRLQLHGRGPDGRLHLLVHDRVPHRRTARSTGTPGSARSSSRRASRSPRRRSRARTTRPSRTSSPGTFTVTTTGSPTPAISETGALPSGVTFTDNGNGTATLAGTPAAGTAGSYPLTISAANGVLPTPPRASR